MKQLLQRAAEEIRMLRRQNEVANARLEVVEIFGMALRASSGRSIGMSEDIAWALDRAVEDMEREQKAVAETNAQ